MKCLNNNKATHKVELVGSRPGGSIFNEMGVAYIYYIRSHYANFSFQNAHLLLISPIIHSQFPPTMLI